MHLRQCKHISVVIKLFCLLGHSDVESDVKITFIVLLVQGNVLDTTALVRSCVQSAVGMLRDQTEAGTRSTRRVEILLMLLTDDGMTDFTVSLVIV